MTEETNGKVQSSDAQAEEKGQVASGENSQENSQRNPAEHLKEYRWPKGFCPNPGGRPKSKPVSDRLRDALESGSADVIASKLLAGAEAGELAFIKEIIDRVEGKPIASTEVSGPDGGPIDATIEIVLVRPNENGVS